MVASRIYLRCSICLEYFCRKFLSSRCINDPCHCGGGISHSRRNIRQVRSITVMGGATAYGDYALIGILMVGRLDARPTAFAKLVNDRWLTFSALIYPPPSNGSFKFF